MTNQSVNNQTLQNYWEDVTSAVARYIAFSKVIFNESVKPKDVHAGLKTDDRLEQKVEYYTKYFEGNQ